jgi:hypothetical protein
MPCVVIIVIALICPEKEFHKAGKYSILQFPVVQKGTRTEHRRNTDGTQTEHRRGLERNSNKVVFVHFVNFCPSLPRSSYVLLVFFISTR